MTNVTSQAIEVNEKITKTFSKAFE